MSWNHRLIRRKCKTPTGYELLFAVHEVYYNENGKPHSLTAEPSAPYGESVSEFVEDLKRFEEASKLPVLEWDDLAGET